MSTIAEYAANLFFIDDIPRMHVAFKRKTPKQLRGFETVAHIVLPITVAQHQIKSLGDIINKNKLRDMLASAVERTDEFTHEWCHMPDTAHPNETDHIIRMKINLLLDGANVFRAQVEPSLKNGAIVRNMDIENAVLEALVALYSYTVAAWDANSRPPQVVGLMKDLLSYWNTFGYPSLFQDTGVKLIGDELKII